MLKLAHFEITATDVDGVAAFYAKILGWTASPAGFIPGYTMLDAGGGPTGSVMSRSYKSQPAILWFATDDIAATAAEIVAAGGKQQDEIHALPDGRRVVYVTDPAGNIFGLTEGHALT
jgi:predicted enzyme related to lactoylglutathione lyase